MTTTIPLQIIELQGDGFHPLVEVVVFGKPFILVLDTGASKTAFDKTMLQEANEFSDLLETDQLSTGLGTNTMASFIATIHDMQIAHSTFQFLMLLFWIFPASTLLTLSLINPEF